MKLTCSQENLAKGLSIVKRAVASRSFLPILSNVMLSTDNGRLRLSATNLEISISCWIEAEVKEDGATTVPANTLVDLVSSLPSENIDLELGDNETLKLRCARHKSNLKGIEAMEFPILPIIEAGEGFAIPTETFMSLAKTVAISASHDESRPILTGVLILIEENKLAMAAADGFRLSECEASLSLDTKPTGVIVPASSLHELVRIDSGDTIKVVIDENRAIFETEAVSIVAQLIEGNFPDYRQIIPTEYTTRTKVDTKALQRACAITRIFAKEVNDYVQVVIENDKIILTTKTEIGDNRAEVDAQVSGDNLTFALNVKYLVDALSVISSENVVLETNTASTPIVIKPEEGMGLHVIMPMSMKSIDPLRP
jgi:DNA polymerase-3 subunit beta